jgi:hypothetical protein
MCSICMLSICARSLITHVFSGSCSAKSLRERASPVSARGEWVATTASPNPDESMCVIFGSRHDQLCFTRWLWSARYPPLHQILRIFLRVCEAVAVMHNHSTPYVHWDLKARSPEYLMARTYSQPHVCTCLNDIACAARKHFVSRLKFRTLAYRLWIRASGYSPH